MKHFLSTIAAFFVFALAALAQNDVQSMQIDDSLTLASYGMKNIDGTQQTIQDNKGKNGIVVIFSCNTCPFVVGSDSFSGWEKSYNSVYKEAKALGYNVILVNSNEAKRTNDDSFEKMQERAKAQGYEMPYLVDENSKLADALGAKTTPHVFVFNSSNHLVYNGSIDNSVDSKRKKDEPYLVNALKELAANKPATVNSTPPRGCSIKRVSAPTDKK